MMTEGGYKSKIEKNWQRICQHIDNKHFPHPYDFNDLSDKVSKIEYLLKTSQTLDYDKIRKQYVHALWTSEIPLPGGSSANTHILTNHVINNDKEMFLEEMSIGTLSITYGFRVKYLRKVHQS